MGKRVCISLLASILLLLISPSFLPVSFLSSLAVTSNCVVTKTGNPAGQPQLPAGCNSASGVAAKVIELAKKQIGKDYIYGTPTPRTWSLYDPQSNAPTNFDCSGLTGWAWYWGTEGKVNLPGSTGQTWGVLPKDQFQQFTPSDKPQPGDLLFWGTPSHHTALFVGAGECGSDDCFIEAPDTNQKVKWSSLKQRTNEYVGFLRPVVK